MTTTKTNTNTMSEMLGGISEGIQAGLVAALTGVSLTQVEAALGNTSPTYPKFGEKVGEVLARRARKAACSALEGDLSESKTQGEKLSRELRRLNRIDTLTKSASHWDHFKGRMRRAAFAIDHIGR